MLPEAQVTAHCHIFHSGCSKGCLLSRCQCLGSDSPDPDGTLNGLKAPQVIHPAFRQEPPSLADSYGQLSCIIVASVFGNLSLHPNVSF
jgi:hypothetical protein